MVAAGGHRDLGTTPGDFIVAFALPGKGVSLQAPATIAAGHYEGRMILDKTRSPAAIDLTIAHGTATIALVTQKDVKGRGTATIDRDSAVADVAWEYLRKTVPAPCT